MIDPQTVQKILDTADIVDVVSDYVTLHRKGANYTGLCPFHDEKTPSFIVSPAKGFCKCFGCGKGGSPVNFIMEQEKLSFPDALRHLAKKYNIPIEERELTDKEKASINERESQFAVNEWAKNYFSHTLKETPEGKNVALGYFHERGISDVMIEKFGLGYCLNDYTAMSKEAIAKGYKEEFLIKTGLVGKSQKGDIYDRFKGRVMFPIYSISGKVVAFGGRIMVKDDKSAKYVNSPESEIYHKSNELFGIFQAKSSITKLNKCYLVEGYTDVISMHQSGITNVVAPCGTAFTNGQINKIHKLTPNVTLIYDGDKAGINASVKGINLLLAEGVNVKVVLLPDGEDPDSYARSNNAVDFIKYIEDNESDFVRFKINLHRDELDKDPMKRAELIRDITHSIAIIPDAIVRSVYTKDAARLLDISESILHDEVKKHMDKAKADEAKKQGFAYGKTTGRKTEPEYRKAQPNYVPRPAAPAHEVMPQTPQTPPPPAPPMDYMLPEELPAEAYAPFDDGYVPPMPDDHYVPPMPDDYHYAETQDAPQAPLETAQSENFVVNKTRYENEKEIISFIVRHGDEIMLHEEDENGTPIDVSVGQYVLEELAEFKESNGAYLQTPLYDKMMNILSENAYNEGFKAYSVFVKYPDPEVSMESASLLSDKYELSKIFTQADEFTGDPNNEVDVEMYRHRMMEKNMIELHHAVSKSVLTYKYNVIMDMHSQVLAELKHAEQQGDMETLFAKIKRLTEINSLQNKIAPLVGKRVINARS